MSIELSPPEGFVLSERSSNMLDLVGPLYESGSGRDYRIGLRVDQRHVNEIGRAHV